MAIKFNHVTNTISFTSGACSASFVDSSATGIFETTGYARNCYITTGQTGNFVTASQTGVFALSANTGNFVTASQTGCFITTGQTGAFGGGGGGGTTLPNGTSENSALCWDGTAWVAAQTYVATGQTGDFSAHDFNFSNFNVTYKCNSNTISNSTGSAILEGSGNCIDSSLHSQINNGCRNTVGSGCHNYIENGFCNSFTGLGNTFSNILNGCCNRIANSSCHASIINGACNCINASIVGGIVNSCCSIICAGTASSVIGGACNCNCFSSRSVIVAGQINFLCGSSTDSSIVGGSSHGIVGAFNSVLIGGSVNRLCHASTNTQTGNVIIGGCNNRIGGCFSTSHNAIINSLSSCICSGSSNVLIGSSFSCLMSGASNSLIIGPCNIVCGFTGAVIIGSGITANANNTLFVGNLRSTGIISGNICGTGNFVTTSQTGAFALAAATGNFVTTSQTGCFITTGQTGAFGGGGGGTTLPNGSSTNSALCWNGSAWVAAQTYVATGQTGNFVRTSQTGCFITTGQTGAFGGGGVSSLCSGINTLYESFAPSNIVSTNLINFDIIPNSTLFYTGNSTSNFYLNLRGSSSCALNSLLPLNNSVSVSFLHVNGSTPYSLTGLSIDGTGTSVVWAGGGGAPSGAANAINVYSITAFKTANNSFRVLGSLGFFS